jgi:hypothetical protein
VIAIGKSLDGAAAILAATIEETIASKGKPKPAEGELGYVKPSSLAKGCMLYIALELKGTPKAEIDSRVQRILEVGTASHNRIPRYFARLTAAREMFFQNEEYRIHGYADALVYVPAERDAALAGFYVVEMKTTGASARFTSGASYATTKPSPSRAASSSTRIGTPWSTLCST